jgi:hypothetical protein
MMPNGLLVWLRGSGLGRIIAGRHVAQAREYDRYVEHLSDRLYRRTLGEGGWAADIGVYGPALFRGDARRMVHEIALGSATSGLPSP